LQAAGTSVQHDKLFNADSGSILQSHDGSMHFQHQAEQSRPGQPNFYPQREEETENVRYDFNAIAALRLHPQQTAPDEDSQQMVAKSPNPGASAAYLKEQASFISYIPRDKDASFAIMSQSNNSIIQNSQYMNASFLAANNTS